MAVAWLSMGASCEAELGQPIQFAFQETAR